MDEVIHVFMYSFIYSCTMVLFQIPGKNTWTAGSVGATTHAAEVGICWVVDEVLDLHHVRVIQVGGGQSKELLLSSTVSG